MDDPHGAMRPIEGQPLSRSAMDLASGLGKDRPSAAIAVLLLRLDPETKAISGIITCVNDHFQDLCDTGPITGPDIKGIFVTSAVFRHDDTKSAFHASTKRCYDVAAALMQRQLTYASLYKIHVSRAGRMWKVFKEFFVVKATETECEYVISHRRLRDNFAVTSDLAPPYSFGPILHETPTKRRPVQQHTTRRAATRHAMIIHSGPDSTSEEAGDDGVLQWEAAEIPLEKIAKWRGDFACARCGVRDTTQRRRGPGGVGTLCNACGLRWRKESRSSPHSTPASPLKCTKPT